MGGGTHTPREPVLREVKNGWPRITETDHRRLALGVMPAVSDRMMSALEPQTTGKQSRQ